MAITDFNELTPREHLIMEADKEEARLSREHAVTIKRLELEIIREKNQAEIELKRLEAKWSSWLKLPSMIIKWPLFIFFGVGYLIEAIKGEEPSNKFWQFIK